MLDFYLVVMSERGSPLSHLAIPHDLDEDLLALMSIPFRPVEVWSSVHV